MEGMKDSGIRWIGNIPKSWKTKRIKYLSTLKGRIGWQGLTSDEYQDEGAYLITGVNFSNGGIDWESCEHVPMQRWDEAKDIQIENGDLLITKDGTIGKVALVENMPGETSLNSGVLRIMTYEGYDRKYLYWVLQSDVFWNWFNFKNAGNSTIQHLYQGDFEEFIYAYPEESEQQAIADFLDDKCSQIDSIIADIEKQIEILKSYKKSLITETVTKGLDKNAKMKDCTLDFAKAVNCDWKITKIKYICNMYSGNNLTAEDIEEDGDFPVYGGNGIRGYYSEYSNDGEYIIVGRQGALCGNIHLTEGKFWATDHAVVTYLKPFYDSHFIKYLFESMNFNQYSQSAAQPGLAVSTIMNLRTVIPESKSEQHKISKFLDDKCNQIDSIITTKQAQLTKMQQHKKSLIYEYVTGKKRVAI